MLQPCLLWKMSMSHMTSLQHHLQMLKPPHIPYKQNWIPKKKKPQAMNRSKVWLHFTKVEPIDKENPKAACNYCNRMLGCHWKHGTSALMTHITSNYPTSPLRNLEKSNVPKSQTLLETVI
jgi:hypothetical protein